MLNYLDLLMEWTQDWNGVGRPGPSARAQLGDANVEKPSAWLVLEGEDAAGQLTVWDSGECELEAYRVADGAVVMLEHRDLSTAEDLWSACQALVVACGGTTG
ncbi:immunity protein TriTu family protein [Nocardioides acrostichi]|uniref:Uncharacterized protein n=1 Tax=Nocardioides acrostichi TaxID=2784339 RepID=A0A930V344_9ACTN|nr:hypothetical protein [Nocardioides acrostichi]MBF4162319.1 hypothetical protein [Nocardioides acrostichi]